MLDHSNESIYPSNVTIYEDITLERVNQTISLSQSELCLSQSFTGDINGSIRMATDLKLLKLKRSQVAFVEGVICEAFNMISQEILLNLCESRHLSILKLPTSLTRKLHENIQCHQLYRLNLPNGFCHLVIEMKTGGLN